MAKLSERQKSNIRAKYKTGEYTKAELAKSYKVDEKTIRNITKGVEPENAHIVEACVMVEKAKKSGKSPAEVTAIEQAVKYRLEKEFNADNNRVKVYDVTTKILDKVSNLVEGGKAQKVVSSPLGAEVIEYDLQAKDLKEAMETVDKASITLNVNARHAPKTEITNTNAQQTNIEAPEIEGYSVELIDVEEVKGNNDGA